MKRAEVLKAGKEGIFAMKTLDQVDLSGKRVFLRVDFNVPLSKDRASVTDDRRIRAILPSLEKIRGGGGKAVLASHLGRPKGQRIPEYSLKPAAAHLSKLLGRDVPLAPDCVGDGVKRLVEALQPGEAILLENLRFHPGEEKNDPDFSRRLAELADVYVNDAFAVSHRAHASVEGITRHVPVCAAGCQLEKELHTFREAMEDPKRPLAVVIGGAKVSTKIGLLENLVPRIDLLVIGGAMANTFLKQKGFGVGRSLVEDDHLQTAGELLEKAAKRGVRVVLPVDVVVAPRLDEGASARAVPVNEVPADAMAFDVGPKTMAAIREALSTCRTIVWNGPMGVFETPPFHRATFELAEFLGRSEAFTVVGGGDSASAVDKAGAAEKVSYVSTGGGAFLEMLEGKTLPGVAALEECSRKS